MLNISFLLPALQVYADHVRTYAETLADYDSEKSLIASANHQMRELEELVTQLGHYTQELHMAGCLDEFESLFKIEDHLDTTLSLLIDWVDYFNSGQH